MEKFDRRTDDEMLQLFKGRGGRSKLVRLVPARSLDRGKEELPLWIEGCCEWIDYLRQRKIRSVADLEVDLKRVGILGTEPPNLFAPAVKAVEPWLDLPELRYRKKSGRGRLGRIVFGVLWCKWRKSPATADEAVKKLLQRARGRRQVRVVRVDPAFVRELAAAEAGHLGDGAPPRKRSASP